MAGNQRTGVGARDVPKAGLVEMAEVDHDPQLAAAAHERSPSVGEARSSIRTRWRDERDAVAEVGGPAPDRSQRPQPGGIPELQCLKPGVARLRDLQGE